MRSKAVSTITRGTRILPCTHPMDSVSRTTASSLQLSKSKVRYSSFTARAMPWYSNVKARRTFVMWIGRKERLRTRTLVLSMTEPKRTGSTEGVHAMAARTASSIR
jgi:hypothetical protein